MKDALQKYRITGDRKAKKKKFRRYLFSGLAVFAVLLVIFFLKLLLSWQGLEVSRISVANPTLVSDASLVSAIKDQMLQSKLRALVGPTNILFWGLGTKPSSLENLPALRSVSISSDIFQKTVSIDAVPRTPFGVICEATSTTCFTFDKTGIIFSPSPDVQGPLILKINDMTGRNLILGENILPEQSWLNNFLSVVNDLKNSAIGVKEIDFNSFSLREWQVSLLHGPVFYFSFDFVPDNFGYVLSNLASRMNFSKTSYIDFRVMDRIYYR